MAVKKRTPKAPKEVLTPQYAVGDRVRVLYRGIEHVGTIQVAEVRRGAIAYTIEWSPESLLQDPALRGMKRASDGDVVGVVGQVPMREITNAGFAARMAARREV